MNRKAFTLVELLGSLVILGLLLAITLPIVTNSIENSRNSLYRSQEKIILKSAVNWAEVNNNKLPLKEPEEKKKIAITLGLLKAEGYLSGELTNPNTGYLYPNDMIINISYDDSVNKKNKTNIKYNGNYKFELDENSGTELNLTNNIPATTLNICGTGLETDNNSETIKKCISDNLDIIYKDSSSGRIFNQDDVKFFYNQKQAVPIELLKEYEYNNSDGKVKTIDMSKYGFYYTYYTFGRQTDLKIFMINDLEPPTITFSSDYVTEYTKGSTINLLNGVSCEDNSGYCNIKTSGNINPNKEGSYVIRYIFSDESGNTSTQKKVITIN